MNKLTPFLKENKKTVLTLLVTVIFADIIFLNKSSDLIIFSVLILYSVAIKIFNLKSRLAFFISLFLLVMMFSSYLFSGTSVSTEKAAVWLILFLAIGIIQQWRE